MGREVWIRSMSARFMNCSSASTRVVLFTLARKVIAVSTARALKRYKPELNVHVENGRDRSDPHLVRGGGGTSCPQSRCPQRPGQSAYVKCGRVIMSLFLVGGAKAPRHVLIVHDRGGAHKLVNRWVTFTLQLGNSTFGSLNNLAQSVRDAATDVTNGLEPAHLVPDSRDTFEQVGLLGA